MRKWAYEQFGDERAIEFTVMATPEDLKVNADYIRMADRFVEVPGGTNNNNYANVDLIVDVAERSGVHAVWAGWGHASENPRLPESLAASKHKIVFIGPPGSAMRSLGDKISSTIVAQSAKVPCMPWSGTGIEDTVMSPQGFVTVPDGPYNDACVKTWEDGLGRAEKIGFPVMIKASEGGGGKGIRMVAEGAAFKNAFAAVVAEVPGASPCPAAAVRLPSTRTDVSSTASTQARPSSLWLSPARPGISRSSCLPISTATPSRSLAAIARSSAGTRRSSRRPPSPSPGPSASRRWRRLPSGSPSSSATSRPAPSNVSLATPVDLDVFDLDVFCMPPPLLMQSPARTDLYSHSDDSFFFLELNPRLQVEHPTTEMVSGVNLPAAQLQIAMGIPLSRIRDIRVLYGLDPHGVNAIDFDFSKPESVQSQKKPRPKGHVVACRITSENPEDGFKPSGGDIQELNFRSNTNVWGYFSVGAAGGIHSVRRLALKLSLPPLAC